MKKVMTRPNVVISSRPETINNSTNLSHMFSLAEQGEINELKKVTLKYNFDLTTKDPATDDNIIHKFLKVDDKKLSENEKLIFLQYYLEIKNLNINEVGENNLSYLHIATDRKYEKIVEYLLNKKINTELIDVYGNKALHYSLNTEIVPCEESKKVDLIYKKQEPIKNEELRKIKKKLEEDSNFRTFIVDYAKKIVLLYKENSTEMIEIIQNIINDQLVKNTDPNKDINKVVEEITNDLYKYTTSKITIPEPGNFEPDLPNLEIVIDNVIDMQKNNLIEKFIETISLDDEEIKKLKVKLVAILSDFDFIRKENYSKYQDFLEEFFKSREENMNKLLTEIQRDYYYKKFPDGNKFDENDDPNSNETIIKNFFDENVDINNEIVKLNNSLNNKIFESNDLNGYMDHVKEVFDKDDEKDFDKNYLIYINSNFDNSGVDKIKDNLKTGNSYKLFSSILNPDINSFKRIFTFVLQALTGINLLTQNDFNDLNNDINDITPQTNGDLATYIILIVQHLFPVYNPNDFGDTLNNTYDEFIKTVKDIIKNSVGLFLYRKNNDNIQINDQSNKDYLKYTFRDSNNIATVNNFLNIVGNFNRGNNNDEDKKDKIIKEVLNFIPSFLDKKEVKEYLKTVFNLIDSNIIKNEYKILKIIMIITVLISSYFSFFVSKLDTTFNNPNNYVNNDELKDHIYYSYFRKNKIDFQINNISQLHAILYDVFYIIETGKKMDINQYNKLINHEIKNSKNINQLNLLQIYERTFKTYLKNIIDFSNFTVDDVSSIIQNYNTDKNLTSLNKNNIIKTILNINETRLTEFLDYKGRITEYFEEFYNEHLGNLQIAAPAGVQGIYILKQNLSELVIIYFITLINYFIFPRLDLTKQYFEKKEDLEKMYNKTKIIHNVNLLNQNLFSDKEYSLITKNHLEQYGNEEETKYIYLQGYANKEKITDFFEFLKIFEENLKNIVKMGIIRWGFGYFNLSEHYDEDIFNNIFLKIIKEQIINNVTDEIKDYRKDSLKNIFQDFEELQEDGGSEQITKEFHKINSDNFDVNNTRMHLFFDEEDKIFKQLKISQYFITNLTSKTSLVFTLEEYLDKNSNLLLQLFPFIVNLLNTDHLGNTTKDRNIKFMNGYITETYLSHSIKIFIEKLIRNQIKLIYNKTNNNYFTISDVKYDFIKIVEDFNYFSNEPLFAERTENNRDLILETKEENSIKRTEYHYSTNYFKLAIIKECNKINKVIIEKLLENTNIDNSVFEYIIDGKYYDYIANNEKILSFLKNSITFKLMFLKNIQKEFSNIDIFKQQYKEKLLSRLKNSDNIGTNNIPVNIGCIFFFYLIYINIYFFRLLNKTIALKSERNDLYNIDSSGNGKLKNENDWKIYFSDKTINLKINTDLIKIYDKNFKFESKTKIKKSKDDDTITANMRLDEFFEKNINKNGRDLSFTYYICSLEKDSEQIPRFFEHLYLHEEFKKIVDEIINTPESTTVMLDNEINVKKLSEFYRSIFEQFLKFRNNKNVTDLNLPLKTILFVTKCCLISFVGHNFYIYLLKYIYSYLEKQTPKQSNDMNNNKRTNEILKKASESLKEVKEYLTGFGKDKLTHSFIKVFSNIPETEDENKEEINIKNLFELIHRKITTENLSQGNSENYTSMMNNITDNIIPYYKDIYTITTEELLNFGDSYNRFVINEYYNILLFGKVFY